MLESTTPIPIFELCIILFIFSNSKSKGKAKLKVVHISPAEIGNVFVAIPPLEEQAKIALYLDEKLSAINKLVGMKQLKIDNLKNYKKSLIYEYVTGKKRVSL